MTNTCISCGDSLKTRHQIKFCSNKCQNKRHYKLFLDKWKNGLASGNIGFRAKNISGHVRKYLFTKYQNRCSQCGWNEINTATGRVPLEVDHIDGNSENSTEENLRLLCPNCHSLTPHFRNLNKGKGRVWRMDKYIKNRVKDRKSP